MATTKTMGRKDIYDDNLLLSKSTFIPKEYHIKPNMVKL